MSSRFAVSDVDGANKSSWCRRCKVEKGTKTADGSTTLCTACRDELRMNRKSIEETLAMIDAALAGVDHG